MALPQLSIWQPGDGLRKIKYKYHVCLTVIFSVLIRLLFLTDRYLWCDEASSVLISRHSVDNLLFHAAFDVHPPLYYRMTGSYYGVIALQRYALSVYSLGS